MSLTTWVTWTQGSAVRPIALLLSMSLAACGGGGSASSAPSPPPPPPSADSGLDQRPSNDSCIAPERPGSVAALNLTRVFPALSFSSPVAMLQAPRDASRWFVVEQDGVVHAFQNTAGVSTTATFVNISARVASQADSAGSETGLLGMAFHPDFPTDSRVFLSYTANQGGLVSRISEFRTTDGGATLDASTENVILTVVQPESNHNGGNIAFGPDGNLYIGFGDGGGGGDNHGSIGNGQNTQTLLGKMLRISVDDLSPGETYGIPSDNPFATNTRCGPSSGSAPCPEIFAIGFRNPWRWSFDQATGELWAGDVGQGSWEEVDRVVLGGNYGWRCREGAHDFNPGACGGASDLIDPVAEYDHAQGFSITGGYVYRGTAVPALQGRYVFGDFGSGNIWHIAPDITSTQRVTAATALASGRSISSFAEGNDAELYVVDYAGGLYRLGASVSGTNTIPDKLSATGCVSTSDTTQPASGLIPYAPNAPFWSDGAEKQRWIALPNGTSITVQNDGDWDLPAGTVLMKHFRLGGRLVETRLLMRHPDNEWAGYTYEWDVTQTEATRVVGGKTTTIGSQQWIFPSEADCLACHTGAAGRTLGLETAQLNGDLTYPQTGRTANQVVTLNHIMVLSPPVTEDPASLPAIPDPSGTRGTVDERARAYLHTNCAQCHRPGGPMPGLDLRYSTTLADTGTCNIVPNNDLGIPNALIVAPREPSRSVLRERMNRRDAFAMPPLASNQVDTEGVELITEWINSLPPGC